ncbi:MAG: hypothetical protein IPG65_16840 [Ottowia sp.]|jgi:hypothetical protein|nr:hypothetical protein [Ottowia sp.]
MDGVELTIAKPPRRSSAHTYDALLLYMPNEPQIGAKYFASKQLAFLIDHVFLSCSASSPINGDESMETVVVSRCLFSTPQSPFSSQAETALDPRQLSSPS